MSSSTGDTVAAAPAPSAGSPGKSDVWWIAAAAAVVLACHLQIALTRGINWDEFHYYDWVRQFHAGTLGHPLQSFHARLFGWLLNVPGDVTDRIRAARLGMLACEAGTAVAIFGVARRFASPSAAALTALAYLSGGYVVIHGTAFRTDPQASLLLACALWILATTRLRSAAILGFGLLAGVATLVTIKVAFWAPAFSGIAWLRWRQSPNRSAAAIRIAACVAVSLAAFASLYAWHSSRVDGSPEGAAATVGSAGRVIFSEGFLPQGQALMRQLLIAPHVTALLALTAICWPKREISRDQGLAMFGLLLPLAALVFYRNSYPYFFVFLLPPALIATAPAMYVVVRRVGVAAPAILMAVSAGLLAGQLPRDVLAAQQRTIAVAHGLFPAPVTYFDFCGYLGDHDRALDFMPSGWGLREYRRASTPVFVQAMAKKTVPLLVLNHNVLISAVSGQSRGETLLEADAQALRENYIPHWGILWVAGKRIPAGSEPALIEVRVPGAYTLEGGEIILDGTRFKPGQVMRLQRGVHRVGGGRADQATLRWGDHLQVPTDPVPAAGPYATLD